MERKIIRNAARCRQCGDEIESLFRHDFKWCSCGDIFVDGGFDYLRRGGNPEDCEDLSEINEDVEITQEYIPNRAAIREDLPPLPTFREMASEAAEAVVARGEQPVFLGKMVSDTEVVVRLAAMSDYEFETAVKWGRVAFLNTVFGFAPRTFTKRVREMRKILADPQRIDENS